MPEGIVSPEAVRRALELEALADRVGGITAGSTGRRYPEGALTGGKVRLSAPEYDYAGLAGRAFQAGTIGGTVGGGLGSSARAAAPVVADEADRIMSEVALERARSRARKGLGGTTIEDLGEFAPYVFREEFTDAPMVLRSGEKFFPESSNLMTPDQLARKEAELADLVWGVKKGAPAPSAEELAEMIPRWGETASLGVVGPHTTEALDLASELAYLHDQDWQGVEGRIGRPALDKAERLLAEGIQARRSEHATLTREMGPYQSSHPDRPSLEGQRTLWVEGGRRLPHVPAEYRNPFDTPPIELESLEQFELRDADEYNRAIRRDQDFLDRRFTSPLENYRGLPSGVGRSMGSEGPLAEELAGALHRGTFRGPAPKSGIDEDLLELAARSRELRRAQTDPQVFEAGTRARFPASEVDLAASGISREVLEAMPPEALYQGFPETKASRARTAFKAGLKSMLSPASIVADAALGGAVGAGSAVAGHRSAAPESAGLLSLPGEGYEGLVRPDDMVRVAEAIDDQREALRLKLLFEDFDLHGFGSVPHTMRLEDLKRRRAEAVGGPLR